MSLLKQLLLGFVVIAATLALWIVYVPSARPLLERAGVMDLLGIDVEDAQAEAGPARGFARQGACRHRSDRALGRGRVMGRG